MPDKISPDMPAGRAAAAVLAEYRAALSAPPLPGPPEGGDGFPPRPDPLDALLAGLDGQDADQDDTGEDEPYTCSTCGSTIGFSLRHGDGWPHSRGEETAASPVEL